MKKIFFCAIAFVAGTFHYAMASEEPFLQNSNKAFSLIKKVERKAFAGYQESQISFLSLLAQQAEEKHFDYLDRMRDMGARVELAPFPIEKQFLKDIKPYIQAGWEKAVSIETELKQMIETGDSSKTLLSVIFSHGCRGGHLFSNNLDACGE